MKHHDKHIETKRTFCRAIDNFLYFTYNQLDKHYLSLKLLQY